MEVLVDSCVLLDIFTRDPIWFSWSQNTLSHYGLTHSCVINPIIYAEVSVRFSDRQEFEDLIPERFFRRDNLPWNAAFLAGKAFLNYKTRGGIKNATLPDFFIGAHAEATGMPLMTRDVNRYRTYFPQVTLISPDPI